MDLKFGFHNIEFGWVGFGSKSFSKEPSLSLSMYVRTYVLVQSKHLPSWAGVRLVIGLNICMSFVGLR